MRSLIAPVVLLYLESTQKVQTPPRLSMDILQRARAPVRGYISQYLDALSSISSFSQTVVDMVLIIKATPTIVGEAFIFYL